MPIKDAEITDIIEQIYELLASYGFDPKTTELLESLQDHELSVALLEKLCAAIGELIDLLAQPDTNEFGFKHNTSVKLDGINHRIEKILNELRLIGKGTRDDKSVKREHRLKFLEKAAEAEIPKGSSTKRCKQLFSIMCNYLNGGLSGDDQLDGPIVVTVGGGNLITIYAQLLDNILTSTTINSIIKPFRTMLANLARITGVTINELIIEIKAAIEEDSIFKQLIREIANGPRSDLDFKLAPNWREKTDDGSKSSDTSSSADVVSELQFILARIKVSRLCNIMQLTPDQRVGLKINRINHEKRLKSSCYVIAGAYSAVLEGKFDRNILKNLYTGQMKKEYLSLIEKLRDNILKEEEEERMSKQQKKKASGANSKKKKN